MSYRFAAACRAVRDVVGKGEIGDVYAGELVFHNAYGPDKSWFYDRALSGGGCVLDLGIHLVDMALWTLGFPEIVSIVPRLFENGRRIGPGEPAVETFASIALEAANGAVLQLFCSWGLHAGRDAVISADFHGRHGGASFRNVGGSFYDFIAERYEGTASERLAESARRLGNSRRGGLGAPACERRGLRPLHRGGRARRKACRPHLCRWLKAGAACARGRPGEEACSSASGRAPRPPAGERRPAGPGAGSDRKRKERSISILNLMALLLVLTASFGWINRRFFGFPQAIALLLMGLGVSLLLIVAEALFPTLRSAHHLARSLESINFPNVVLNGMLGFLLFAGAYSVDLRSLRERAWHIAFLAIVGTPISAGLVAAGFYYLSHWAGSGISFAWCLVLGALISPTDPVAVLASLKSVSIPRQIEAEIQGEALFNDGVGIVLFMVFLGVASRSHGDVSAAQVAVTFLREAGGGLILGLSLGFVAYLALQQIDDFSTEVLVTLALVTATYALANVLETSGPLAVVAAGLLVGSRGRRYAMSEVSEKYVTAVWGLIDEILNALLFMLIGLQVLVLRQGNYPYLLSAMTIPLVLSARLIALTLPLVFFRTGSLLSIRNVPFLTWAGVRGGISVALALSLPDTPAAAIILAATYAVVLFSIIVQGATLPQAARRTVRRTSEQRLAGTDGEETGA